MVSSISFAPEASASNPTSDEQPVEAQSAGAGFRLGILQIENGTIVINDRDKLERTVIRAISAKMAIDSKADVIEIANLSIQGTPDKQFGRVKVSCPMCPL